MGVVPPVDADVALGTEGRVGLQAGALQAGVGHKAAVKHARVVVVLGGYQGVARGEHAVREGARVRLWAALPTSPARLPGHPPRVQLSPYPTERAPVGGQWQQGHLGEEERAQWTARGQAAAGQALGQGGAPCYMAASFGGASLIPALNASSVPGQLLSLRPPAQLTLLRRERSGRTEKAQGYLSRQLSPVDIGSPRPGPSVTQHLPTGALTSL